MTLRFFRRKSSAAKSASADKKSEGKPKATTRRRTSATAKRTKTASRPKRTSAKATSEKKSVSTSTAKSTTSKTRRGRRGGVGRNKQAKAAASAERATTPASVIPLRGNSGVAPIPTTPPDQLTDKQLAEEQLLTLRALQGSLSAIENRLAGIERVGGVAEQPRVGIFVDVPNVIYAAERAGVKLDYKKVLDFILGSRELVRASAYAPISDAPGQKLETQKFVQPFDDLGYRVVTKPHKRYADGSMKANFDVELAMDVLTMSDRLDIVTLVSGDGDFRRLVEIVASKGVRVEVVAFGESTASELRAVADQYIDFNDHLDALRAD